mgnify:CR=1 FL=1
MSQDNQFLKDVQKEVTSHVEKQKQLWTQEQEKAKVLFEELKQESIHNFESAKANVQKHIEEVNVFTKNLHNHFQSQPFDIKAFSKVVTDYQSKQLEIIAEAAREQAQKLAEFQNKLVSYYHNAQDKINQATEEVVEKMKPTQKPAPKKPVAKKTVAKKTVKKSQ